MYILPAEGFGGAERQGVLHMRLLPRFGIDVVPVVGPGPVIGRQLEAAGLREYVFCPEFPKAMARPPTLLGQPGRGLGYVSSYFRLRRKLIALGRAHHVDAVFASRAFGWAVGSAVGRRLGVPVIWRTGSRPSRRAHVVAVRTVARLIAPDLLVTNSDVGSEILRSLLRVPTKVVPNGVDERRFDPARVAPRFRQPGTSLVVGLAARPTYEKGLDSLAEVTRLLVQQVPSVRVLVAGDFAWRDHFHRRFHEAGLDERVSFLGHVDDVESFYASCDVVVLTSHRQSIEMSSNAILEAMAMERPVVVSDVGGMAEVVREGEHGFLVDPDEPAMFAARIATLLDDGELRARMGLAGRATILARHRSDVVTARLAELIARVCGRPQVAEETWTTAEE
jgi:glycosyltransferase involved in cell wall biosynthesis